MFQLIFPYGQAVGLFKGIFGHMVAVRNNEFVKVTLRDVAKGKRLVPRNHPLVESARSVGTSFGE